MLNNKKLIISLLLVIAVGAGIFFLKPTDKKVPNPNTTTQEPTTQDIVYALEKIPSGTMIDDNMIAVKTVNRADVSRDSVRYSDEVIGRKTKVDIEEGDTILYGNLKLEQNPFSIAYKIPTGMRAVLMPIGSVHEMASFVEVGDRIDIVLTYETEAGLKTITQFQNIEILSVGETRMPTAEAQGRSLILSVTPAQAEMLSYLRISNQLESTQITVRGYDDTEPVRLDSYGDENFDDWRNR